MTVPIRPLLVGHVKNDQLHAEIIVTARCKRVARRKPVALAVRYGHQGLTGHALGIYSSPVQTGSVHAGYLALPELDEWMHQEYFCCQCSSSGSGTMSHMHRHTPTHTNNSEPFRKLKPHAHNFSRAYVIILLHIKHLHSHLQCNGKMGI